MGFVLFIVCSILYLAGYLVFKILVIIWYGIYMIYIGLHSLYLKRRGIQLRRPPSGDPEPNEQRTNTSNTPIIAPPAAVFANQSTNVQDSSVDYAPVINRHSSITRSDNDSEQALSAAPSYHTVDPAEQVSAVNLSDSINHSTDSVLTVPPACARINGSSREGSIQFIFDPDPTRQHNNFTGGSWM